PFVLRGSDGRGRLRILHGRRKRLGHLAAVCPALEGQVQRLSARWGGQGVIDFRPRGGGAAELAAIGQLFDGVPIISGTHNVPASAWTTYGITQPTGTSGDPNDILRVISH